MSGNRDLAAAFGVLAVAWPFLGFATGFEAQYLSASFQLVLGAVTLLILIFIPLVRSTTRWTALGAGIAGIIMVIWIGEVALKSGSAVSTGALASLCFWDIDVLIMTQRGRPVAMLKSLDDDSHVKTRLCQYEAYQNGRSTGQPAATNPDNRTQNS